jgi:hypothetical protein
MLNCHFAIYNKLDITTQTGDTVSTVIAEKPKFLQAVEMILADPADIKRESTNLITKIKKANPSKSESEVRHIASEKIISNYSYYAAFTGGTTALTGVIPGIGTAVQLLAAQAQTPLLL